MKPPLEGRVLLHIFAVLVERSRLVYVFEIGVWGLRFGVSGVRIGVLNLGFLVSGFWFLVSALGF